MNFWLEFGNPQNIWKFDPRSSLSTLKNAIDLPLITYSWVHYDVYDERKIPIACQILRKSSTWNTPRNQFLSRCDCFKNNQIEVNILRQKKTQNAGNYITFLQFKFGNPKNVTQSWSSIINNPDVTSTFTLVYIGFFKPVGNYLEQLVSLCPPSANEIKDWSPIN